MDQFLKFVSDVFECDMSEITLNTVYGEFEKWDSMMMLRLTMELEEEYQVISLDFQNIESDEYINGSTFVRALTREINKKIRKTAVADGIKDWLHDLADSGERDVRMAEMFACFSEWCEQSVKPVVIVIDEIDTAANNQVFLDFLAQLRAAYLDSDKTAAFQSVILAGVYDVRSMKRKIRSDGEDIRILFRVCVNIWMKRSQEVRNFRIRAAYGQEKVFMRPKE